MDILSLASRAAHAHPQSIAPILVAVPWGGKAAVGGEAVVTSTNSSLGDDVLLGGTPKSSIFMGFSIINHPFWDTPILGNPHII